MIGSGWLRPDGRKGIRNVILVAYLVECAHHVARAVVDRAGDEGVHLIGFPGCYPNSYSLELMKALGTHPNVGGAVLLSLGCEGFDRDGLAAAIADSGRPIETVVIQDIGGTQKAIAAGLAAVERVRQQADRAFERVDLDVADLVVGAICGGSDGTSGITANPAVGRAFDRLVDIGATCIFEETGEMIGCEGHMAGRAASPQAATAIHTSLAQAADYYRTMGLGSFAPGNADGGLSSQEEKSAGAYAKSGGRPVRGVIRPGESPSSPGLWLLDVVPSGAPKFGFPNIADNAEIIELISCGAHLILFTTGRGSVVGSAISPVIKICANPETYRRMPDDMDIDAGAVLEGRATLDDIAEGIFDRLVAVAQGTATVSEALGHREFLLTYKSDMEGYSGCRIVD
jgi:altronate hydrolase